MSLGRGGKAFVSKTLDSRKPIDIHQPAIYEQLESIISPYTCGMPAIGQQWDTLPVSGAIKIVNPKNRLDKM